MKRNGKPRVYSYARFSSLEQAKGDSERRQVEAAREFAKEKGYPFDETLRIDRGLSGFHGTNRKKGALATFLDNVKTGEIVAGSILVVENIDRLGREPMMATLRTILFGLLEYGITIQTLSPQDTYTAASINDHAIWQLVAHIQRAHAESRRKSDLAQANWKQKRKVAAEERRVLTARAPAWLRLVNGKFQKNEEAAEAVHLIFKLKLDGFGKSAIEKRLNQIAPWVPKHGWRASYIQKILHSRAVIGELQPHKFIDRKRVPAGEPIPDYFPVIVRPEIFHAVQRQMTQNRGKGGRTGKATNVFQNLVKCGYCHGSMVLVDKGFSRKGGRYLICDNGRRGVDVAEVVNGVKTQLKCAAHKVRYHEFEQTMLENLRKLRPESVLPHQDEQKQQMNSLRVAVDGLTDELNGIESKIENFIDQVGITPDQSMRDRYEKRISGLESRRSTLESEKVQKETALKELERGGRTFSKWQKDLNGLKEAIAENLESRIRLKAHLKEFIVKVEVFAKGHDDNAEHAEALIEEFFPELERAKSYRAFRRYLRKRLLSPDGRFFKLHVKTGRQLRGIRTDSEGTPIAPPGSLAASISIKPDGLKFSGPKIDTLAKEFFDGRKSGFVPKSTVM